LVFNVNVLSRKTRETMGNPKMVWSPIQLRLANQHKIILIIRLIGVEVNIDGVHSVGDLEVIKIEGDNKSCPVLLGIEWAYDNHEIIDLKKI
jgi:hypothetical protein